MESVTFERSMRIRWTDGYAAMPVKTSNGTFCAVYKDGKLVHATESYKTRQSAELAAEQWARVEVSQ